MALFWASWRAGHSGGNGLLEMLFYSPQSGEAPFKYGTEIPKYTVTSDVTRTGDKTSLHFKLTQSGVSKNFRMVVPMYIEYEDKRVSLIGRATLVGEGTMEQTMKMGKVPVAPKRLLVNYDHDLLTD